MEGGCPRTKQEKDAMAQDTRIPRGHDEKDEKDNELEDS